MMNLAMFRQSQQAIAQTEATMKLTLLAFISTPLSSTISFFSMQVRELENKILAYGFLNRGNIGAQVVVGYQGETQCYIDY